MGDYLDWRILGSLIVIGASSIFVLRGYHRRIPRYVVRNPFFRHWGKELKSLGNLLLFWRDSGKTNSKKTARQNKNRKRKKAQNPKIFINYRRKDTKSEARLLYQKLIAKFPKDNVMMDIDSIPPGEDFRQFLRDSVDNCDIFLALVGSRWLEFGDLHNPNDWVRIEIEAALSQGKRVIPIAVDNARLPSEDILPNAIKNFSSRNALPLDPGRDFNFHMIRIVNSIRSLSNSHRANTQSKANKAQQTDS